MAVALIFFALASLLVSSVGLADADDAEVLPKGRAGFGGENRFFFITERFGPDGKAAELASAFNNRALDSSVFSILAALNPLVPGGRARRRPRTLRIQIQRSGVHRSLRHHRPAHSRSRHSLLLGLERREGLGELRRRLER